MTRPEGARPEDHMDPQLTILLELQDLRSQLRELAEDAGAGEVERRHFNIDLDTARGALRSKIEELEGELSPLVRERYQKILPHRDRVVVPVISGVCYGCFVSIPTATARDSDSHQQLQSCESCGCFIYVLP